jgi:hypothetical protein
MLFSKEIINIYSENRTKPINTFCGKNTELLIVKAGGAYSYQWGFEGSNRLYEVRVFCIIVKPLIGLNIQDKNIFYMNRHGGWNK